MDSHDVILWDNECNDVCVNDVVYGNGDESCRSSYGRRCCKLDAQDTADTQSAADDNGVASDADGADISTEESSGFDAGGGDFGGDFEF